MIRLTVLCENTAGPSLGILGEHGFAAFVETDTETYLFDTGQGHAILPNAACLKKDLTAISKVCLSHGHCDHTGGLTKVLGARGPVAVHAHPGIFSERFAVLKKDHERLYKSIGMPAARSDLEARGARFIYNSAFTEVARGIYLTGEVQRLTAFEKDDPRLVIRRGQEYIQDTVPDDQSLIIDAPAGLVIVLGCAHAGLINTLNHILSHLPGRGIHTIIGGTHIGYLDEAQIEKTITHLKAFPIQRIGVSHCTGLAPAMRLLQAFADRFFFANAGTVIEV
jgi:7,8-dihydropterin-6-yl-methyl-4-(beta-D-ribofuranosyl)aminobenzene 5'-phosphate synthase